MHLFRGIGVVLIRAFPVNAVTLTVYDGVTSIFDDESRESHQGDREDALQPKYPI